MKLLAAIGLVVVIPAVAGFAASPSLPDEPIYTSSWDLWDEPDEYDGEYVAVTGHLHERDYLFEAATGQLFEREHLVFESPVTTNNIRPVIYVRPVYRNSDNPDNPDASAATAGCANQFVRVYGRFRTWSQYESLINGVYLIVNIKHRTPGPEDVVCWSNPDADPWRATDTVR